VAALGLFLGTVGSLLILVQVLYDTGMAMMQAVIERWRRGEDAQCDAVIARLRAAGGDGRALADVLRSLNPRERELLRHVVVETVATVTLAGFALPVWLAANRWLFRFTPWTDEAARRAHAYMFNMLGFVLIFLGFFLQLIATVWP